MATTTTTTTTTTTLCPGCTTPEPTTTTTPAPVIVEVQVASVAAVTIAAEYTPELEDLESPRAKELASAYKEETISRIINEYANLGIFLSRADIQVDVTSFGSGSVVINAKQVVTIPEEVIQDMAGDDGEVDVDAIVTQSMQVMSDAAPEENEVFMGAPVTAVAVEAAPCECEDGYACVELPSGNSICVVEEAPWEESEWDKEPSISAFEPHTLTDIRFQRKDGTEFNGPENLYAGAYFEANIVADGGFDYLHASIGIAPSYCKVNAINNDTGDVHYLTIMDNAMGSTTMCGQTIINTKVAMSAESNRIWEFEYVLFIFQFHYTDYSLDVAYEISCDVSVCTEHNYGDSYHVCYYASRCPRD